MEKLSRKEMLEHTRQKILIEASILFMSKGYLKTSTRDIAGKVGISQPALYHHFSNKLEIYEQVILDLTYEVKESLDYIVKQDLDLDDKLFELFKVLVIKHPTNLFKMINDIMAEMSDSKKHEMYLLWNDTYLDSLIKFVEEAQAKNAMREALDIRRSARYLLSSISPLIQVENTFLQRDDIEKEIRSIVDFALYGIFK